MASNPVGVRFDARTRRALSQAARRADTTVSEVLREGFRLFELVRERPKGMAQLIALIDGPEPRKVRFEPGRR